MAAKDQKFPKSVRLLRQIEFDRVYESQFFAADSTLVVKAVANERGPTRLGLSISRRVGNAVTRNRWKRLIREAFRKQQADLPGGLDLVVRPRKGAVCDYEAITRSLKQLTQKINRRIKSS